MFGWVCIGFRTDRIEAGMLWYDDIQRVIASTLLGFRDWLPSEALEPNMPVRRALSGQNHASQNMHVNVCARCFQILEFSDCPTHFPLTATTNLGSEIRSVSALLLLDVQLHLCTPRSTNLDIAKHHFHILWMALWGWRMYPYLGKCRGKTRLGWAARQFSSNLLETGQHQKQQPPNHGRWNWQWNKMKGAND